jgi:hypothetical protein
MRTNVVKKNTERWYCSLRFVALDTTGGGAQEVHHNGRRIGRRARGPLSSLLAIRRDLTTR